MFAYGAQYYRPPNPPSKVWSKDFEQMSQLGFNTVKLWAMWNYTHPSKDEFDFSELDELVALGEKKNFNVVISLILENAPHWLSQGHPEARYEGQDGVKVDFQARPNTPGGGWPGLCLNHKIVREHAERYMEALASRYADNETVTSFDTWDEAFFEPNHYYPDKRFCYCEACSRDFRRWLRKRYHDLETLNENWEQRYTDWEQVAPPRYHGGYPRFLDWQRFRLENHQRWMKWRAETLRGAAPDVTLRSHGIAGNLGGLVQNYNDDWESASTVEEWGTSSFPHWMDYPEMAEKIEDRIAAHQITLDVARGAAQGRRFWQTELEGGPVRSGNAGSPRGLTCGPFPDPGEMEIWNWNAIMSGAKGVLYWQYRPEMLGLESPGFGLVRRNGEMTDRTQVAERFAKLTTENPELESSKPVEGDIAIGLLPEAANFNYVAEGNTHQFSGTVQGIYKTLWAADYQIDFAKPHQFENYGTVYLPYPLLLEDETVQEIKSFVKGGGTLITGGTPAVHKSNGRVFQEAPGAGLGRIVGASLLTSRPGGSESLELGRGTIAGKVRRDILECHEASMMGSWSDGGIGAVRNSYEKGETIVLGTLVGISCGEDQTNRSKNTFLRLLSDRGLVPVVESNRGIAKTRLHRYEEGFILYMTNESKNQKNIGIKLRKDLGNFKDSIGDVTYLESENMADADIGVDIDGRSGGALIFG